MSDEEITTEPAGNGKGRGPPENPGGGRGPPSDVPPGREEHPVDEVRDKFENIMDDSIEQGRLGMKVFDEDGNEKNRVEYIRVNGKGSVEAWKYDETSGQTLSPEAENSQWAVRRRDNLDH